jgi:hypothetical protein
MLVRKKSSIAVQIGEWGVNLYVYWGFCELRSAGRVLMAG